VARRRRGAVAAIALVVLLGTVASRPAAAQVEEVTDQLRKAEELPPVTEKGKLVVVPIPVSNPTIGTGLAAGVGYLFHLDPVSKASVIGGGGLRTDNDTWAGAAAASLYLAENTWQVKAGYAYFDANVNFYGIGDGAGDAGVAVPINQAGWAAGFQVLRKVYGSFNAGLQGWYLDMNTSVDPSDLSPDAPEVPPGEADSSIAGVGLVGTFDTRDVPLNPRSGLLLSLSANVAPEELGSIRTFEKYSLSYNHYLGLAERHVLALRFSGCATPGEPPFYALCLLGKPADLRGYVAGQYRDKAMIAAQAEWRWTFHGKFGMVAFAGSGGVAPSLSDFSRDAFVPGYGAGVRYMLSEAYRVNVGIDYARGKGSEAWYFVVGEVF
jgi:outer membrane protein assembly factor BamA